MFVRPLKIPILSLQYLEQCDVVVFMQNGRIVESGTHADLMAKDGGEGQYANMLSFDRGHQSADAVEAAAADVSASKKSVERLHSEKTTGQDVLEQFADEADDNAGAKVLIKYFEVSKCRALQIPPLAGQIPRRHNIQSCAKIILPNSEKHPQNVPPPFLQHTKAQTLSLRFPEPSMIFFAPPCTASESA